MKKWKIGILALLCGCTFLFSACEIPFIGDILGGKESVSSSSSSSDDSSSEKEPCRTDDHVDGDDNGVCDECNESVILSFDIYAVNDLHGKIVENGSQPGVDELTTYFKQARENNPNTIVFSSGDTWQGMAESNLTQGTILTEWMNEVGFASMTLGNHEYDWGESAIEANAALAQFPLLGINVYDSQTNQREAYAKPSIMVEQNGVKIGIIGAIGDCYGSISGEVRNGFYFKTGNELTDLVKAESTFLRAQGADMIIYSLHDGYGESNPSATMSNDSIASYYDIELSDGYVDIVFEGHSHQQYSFKDSKGVYHVQGGGDNRGISRAKVDINFANESCKVNSAKIVSASAYASLSGDPIVDTLLDKYADKIAKVNEEIGYNQRLRNSYEVADLVAKLYYENAQEKWGEEYDVVLGGGMISTRSPYELKAGKLLYRDVYDILPFDNALVLCSISGEKLDKQFVNSTNDKYHVYYEGSIDIDYSKTYYIVTDSYSSTYSYNGATEIARYDNSTYARDFLAEYIREGGLGEYPDGGGDEQFPDYESELTFSEVYSIGNTLAHNQSTAGKYYVRGTITRVRYTDTGCFYITDGSQELYIYRTYNADGSASYGNMRDKPQVGDEVLLYGVVTNYNGTVELKDARIISYESGNQTTDNPYAGMSAAEFYANYTVATSSQDAYYRTQCGFMSGELTVPDQAPTLAANRPMKDGAYIRNSQMGLSADGLTYTVTDSYGAGIYEIYKNGAYITLEEVAAYVYAFGTYPANYTEDKNPSPSNSVWGEYLRANHTYFSGDTTRYPYEPVLPNISGCGGSLNYYEMDIGTTGTDCDPNYPVKLYNDGTEITRGAARIVYGKEDLNDNGTFEIGELHVFYTYNHYNDFQEYLNYEGGWGETFGNVTGGGVLSSKQEYNPTPYVQIYLGLLNGENETPTTPTTPTTPSYALTSIPQLVAIAESLGSNQETTEYFYVEGKITELSGAYGNCWIEDAQGNRLYVYGIWKNGVRYDAISNPPKVGDTVILYGAMKKYVSTDGTVIVEMVHAELQEIQ